MRKDGTYEMKDALSVEDIEKVNRGAERRNAVVNYHFVRIGRHLRCISASYSGAPAKGQR